jgi:23S rRNA pseudouridine2605 synthase
MERIAKVIARRSEYSRRDAEKLISEGVVFVDGLLIQTPAIKVDINANISVMGHQLKDVVKTKLWAYYKPTGCLTTHYDPQGRQTLFSLLPSDMKGVISVGRLDYNTEGLILLSNNGAATRQLELPSTGVVRVYQCKVFGQIPSNMHKLLAKGVRIDGVQYGPIESSINNSQHKQHWLQLKLREGKNREIRNICDYFGLQVSRLIRTEYGCITLGDLEPGELRLLQEDEVQQLLS